MNLRWVRYPNKIDNSQFDVLLAGKPPSSQDDESCGKYVLQFHDGDEWQDVPVIDKLP